MLFVMLSKMQILRISSCLSCDLLHSFQLSAVSVWQCFRLALNSLYTGQGKIRKTIIPDTYFVAQAEIHLKFKM